MDKINKNNVKWLKIKSIGIGVNEKDFNSFLIIMKL